MANARIMWRGFIVMICLILAGVVMSFGFGLTTDKTITGLDDAGIFSGLNPEWDGFYDSTTANGINLLYVICYLPGIIGIAYFLLCCFRSYWREDD